MRKLAALITLLTISLFANTALVPLDRIAVIVDEYVIMQSEIEERLVTIKAQIRSQPGAKAPSDEVLQEQIIERLIVESLQLQTADRAGIRISDDELNQALASIARQNQMDLEQFRIALDNDGVSWAQMREQVQQSATKMSTALKMKSRGMTSMTANWIQTKYKKPEKLR